MGYCVHGWRRRWSGIMRAFLSTRSEREGINKFNVLLLLCLGFDVPLIFLHV
jgi:hypothetical protein